MADDNQPPIPSLQSESFDNRLWGDFDWRHACFVLIMITLAMFGDLLFSNSDRVLSAPGLDLYNGELSGLDGAYRALRNGNVSLWSPHLFSGSFVLATVLYPPNFFNFMLPLPQAVNAGIALHVFLAGFFMYLWAAYRRLHFLACLLAAVLFMFCGPYFMHVFAGHVGNLNAMTWAPLIFLAVDGMMDKPALKWGLLGSFAVAMLILTGQFQYVYYAAIAVVLYGCGRLFFTARRKYVIFGLLTIPVGSLLLTAFQMMPVMSASQEGVRGAGVSIGFAAMFSFPLENLITLAAPFFFGDIQVFPYWGRCYLWEMCIFTGVAGFFLAVHGVVAGERRTRYGLIAMVAILMLLALGAHTPLFRVLFDWLPGYDKFRGTSKFTFFAALFWILLAGYGLDSLLRQGVKSRRFFIIPFAAALMLGGVGVWIFSAATATTIGSFWTAIVRFVANTGESYSPVNLFGNGAFLAEAGSFSALTLYVAAGSCLIVAGLLFLVRSSRRTVYVLVLLAIIEIFAFARLNRPTFAYRDLNIEPFKAFYAAHPGDYRVLSFVNPNTAMSTGAQDIWGYGPVAMGRYVQFMAFTQGADPDRATTYLNIQQYHPLFKMLRLRYVFTPDEKGVRIQEYQDWMPRISLVEDWKAAGSRDGIFQELGKPDFDPRRMVILERSPTSVTISPELLTPVQPSPAAILPDTDSKSISATTTAKTTFAATHEIASRKAEATPPSAVSLITSEEIKSVGKRESATGSKGAYLPVSVNPDTRNTCAILEGGGDYLTVMANTTVPAILLITDNYSKGWRVKPLNPGPQQDYEIMPANYTLMAIPLTAGEHLLRIEYRPIQFIIGAWISAISLIIFGILTIFALRRKKVKDLKNNKAATSGQDSTPSR